MSIRRKIFFLLVAVAVLIATGIQTTSLGSGDNSDNTTGLIAGRNVNMVSGTMLPLGDPWLQRQNEPSIAVSSRNPMHLFAAANDYRTIDMDEPYEVRGIPGVAAGRDAWIGIFQSFDGGESWVTMLLPGFPQDASNEGFASPIYRFDTACDPKVCAGAEGLFYLSGIAFMRNQMAGTVFVARYVDNNNRENVEEVIDENTGQRRYVGPIEYVDTWIAGVGNPGQFIDMPNMAVDVPRGNAPYGNVYLAYTVFLGNTGSNIRSRIVFVTSTDGGANWSKPIKLTESQHIIQRPVITIDPSDPTGKTIYVAFRRFAHRQDPGGIVFVKSMDWGRSFTKPADVASLLCPFDQWTKGPGITSPRTNSYPTMAIGGDGVPYVAWAQRYGQDGLPNPDGQARIVFSYLQNGGMTWSNPQLVDPYYIGDGHQFMPSMTCAGGNRTVIWYDQRDDIALHDPYVPHDPNEKFMEDVWEHHRHTIDVRAAEAPVGSTIFEPSILLSRYLYFMQLDVNGEPYMNGGEPLLWQGEFNFTGLPLFHLGTKPFVGDYIQVVSSPSILPPPAPGFNSWAFNTDSSEPTRAHGVWSDTRDVWPPGGDLWGDWITYNPPNSDQEFPFEQENPCANLDTTGMRNQNIYTADLNHGIIVGSPGNTKQLDRKRTFVVFVKDTIGFNDTNAVEHRSFHLSFVELESANASFDQFDDVDSLDITVPPYSSVSSTVYVKENSNLFAPVIVDVKENGALVGRIYLNPDSTNNTILDPSSGDLGDERHNPGMSNPKIWKYHVGNENEPNASFLSPRAQNPRAQNSGYINPRAQNPRAQNPRAQNPRAQNPRAQNENIVNNEMYNPRAQNPRAQNTALTDMTWTVWNDGNTTSAYSFDIASNDQVIRDLFNQENPPLIAQVLVYKVHTVPIDNECKLFQTHADELIVNVTNPRAQNPRAQNIALTSSNITTLGMSSTEQNDSIEPITFYLAPGEEAEVIFRVYDPNTTDEYSFDDYINDFAGETEAEAVNTEDEVPGATPIVVTQPDVPWGEDPSFLPEIGTSATSLSFAAVLEGADPDFQILTICNTGGETLNYTIADDVDWLSVSPLVGTSLGPPGEVCDEQEHEVSVVVSGLALGTYQGTITITDPNATNNPLRVPVTMTINEQDFEVVFIYSTDTASANSFQTTLADMGISAELLHIDNINSFSFSGYNLVLIGNDTGSIEYGPIFYWGGIDVTQDDPRITRILETGLPVLGIGVGGGIFFDSKHLNLNIGYGGSAWDHTQTAVNKVDPGHIIWTSPNTIGGTTVEIYNALGPRQELWESNVGPNVVTLAQCPVTHSPGGTYFPIVREDRFLHWGFDLSPDYWTQTGKDLFENTISTLSLKPVVFIYSTDTNSANSFQTALAEMGIRAELLHIDNINSFSFSGYNLVLIGNDTGNYNWSWAGVDIDKDDPRVIKIVGTGLPVIAIGAGNFFFDTKNLNLNIGALPSWVNPNHTSILKVDSSHTIWNSPNVIGGTTVDIYQTTGTREEWFDGNMAPDVVILGGNEIEEHHFPIVSQGRFLEWGFRLSPDYWTQTGKDLFENTISLLASKPQVTTVAGTGTEGFSGDGGSAIAANLHAPFDVGVDAAGNIFILDYLNNRVRKVDTSGIITTVAGNGTGGYGGDGGPATSASFSSPHGLGVDSSGNIYIADTYNHRIRKVDTGGTITTVAGNGTAAYSGDGGPATSASLNMPRNVTVDSAGNIFIADSYNYVIRKVDTSGNISTVAGNGTFGYSGDGGPATSAQMGYLGGVAVDSSGNIYIAMYSYSKIRKVDTGGIITTLADVYFPNSIAIDSSDNIYFSEAYRHWVRKVDTGSTITTVVGTGTAGFNGDGGPATVIQLNQVQGIAVDIVGNIYIADKENHRIRKVNLN